MKQDDAISKLIDEGVAAHDSGDLATARERFEAALEQAPDHPEALHLLGLVRLREGERAKALNLIERAIAIDPTEPLFRLNAAAIYENQRNSSSAVKHLRAAAEAAPRDAGILLRLGRAEFRAGRMDEAFRLALRVLDGAPSNLEALKLAAAGAVGLRDWSRVVQIASQWRSIRPGDPDASRVLASAYFELGDTEQARSSYRGALDTSDRSAADLAAYGRYCLAAFDYRGAEEALEEARQLAPQDVGALFGLSRLRFFLGELEESERLCRQAIDADPDFAPAYAHLANLKDGEVDGEFVGAMRRLAESDKTTAEHKASLYFSIGGTLHRTRAFDAAMDAFAKGNAISEEILRTENRLYQFAHAEDLRRRELALFNITPEPEDFPMAPAIPIFVVGMPRSGTTLVESVLAAHPKAFGAGELAALPTIRDSVIRWADRFGVTSLADVPLAQLAAWRGQYFAAWPDTGGARFIIDKQPANFRAIPIIRTLFPEAAIVHIRRNPVETGFSIFRHDFGKAWPFANTLENIAHYYGEYARLMARWEQTAGDALLFIQYEDFTADFESQARRMAAHCGLDWHDACLAFHESKRPIATFSGAQVRKPVQGSMRRVSHEYARDLQPLIDGLLRAGVDLETGAFTGLNPRSEGPTSG